MLHNVTQWLWSWVHVQNIALNHSINHTVPDAVAGNWSSTLINDTVINETISSSSLHASNETLGSFASWVSQNHTWHTHWEGLWMHLSGMGVLAVKTCFQEPVFWLWLMQVILWFGFFCKKVHWWNITAWLVLLLVSCLIQWLPVVTVTFTCCLLSSALCYRLVTQTERGWRLFSRMGIQLWRFALMQRLVTYCMGRFTIPTPMNTEPRFAGSLHHRLRDAPPPPPPPPPLAVPSASTTSLICPVGHSDNLLRSASHVKSQSRKAERNEHSDMVQLPIITSSCNASTHQPQAVYQAPASAPTSTGLTLVSRTSTATYSAPTNSPTPYLDSNATTSQTTAAVMLANMSQAAHGMSDAVATTTPLYASRVNVLEMSADAVGTLIPSAATNDMMETISTNGEQDVDVEMRPSPEIKIKNRSKRPASRASNCKGSEEESDETIENSNVQTPRSKRRRATSIPQS